MLIQTVDFFSPIVDDPQTSCGLLFSLSPAGAELLLAELAGQSGTTCGWIIGEVLPGDKGSVHLV